MTEHSYWLCDSHFYVGFQILTFSLFGLFKINDKREGIADEIIIWYGPLYMKYGGKIVEMGCWNIEIVSIKKFDLS